MWPFSRWTTAGRAALIYISIGTLTVIWAGVWYVYLFNNPPTENAFYWCTGSMITGLGMLFIGLVLGMVHRSARHADQAPASVPMAVVHFQPNAVTSPAPVLVPVNLSAPAVAPNE